MRKHFTDDTLRKAAAAMEPGATRVEWVDDVAPYIRARLTAKAVTFYWVGRNPTTRKTERHRLGILGPTMGTKLAREAAANLKGAAIQGQNIAKHKREAKRTTDGGRATVRTLAAAYIARCEADGKPLAPSTLRSYNEQLPALLGEYFDRPMDALDGDMLSELVRLRAKSRVVKTKHGRAVKRGNSGGAVLATRCIARLCKLNRLPDPTLALRVEKRLPEIKVRQGRLGTVEARDLFAWLHAYSHDESTPAYKVRSARMMMVAIVTGWRIATVQAWQWEEINLKAKTTKLPKNKKRYVQTLPLWPVLEDMLREMHTPGATGPVFDGPWTPGFVSVMPFNASPHDGRKALASHLNNTRGLSPLALKLLMTHFDDVTIKNYVLTTPPADQVRALRQDVNDVSAHFAERIGHKATLRELNALAEQRRQHFREYRTERGAVYWAQYAAKKRAKRAAMAA